MRTTANDTNYPPHARRAHPAPRLDRAGVLLTGPQAREVDRIEARKGEVVVLPAGGGSVEVALVAGRGHGDPCGSVVLDRAGRPGRPRTRLRVSRPVGWRDLALDWREATP